MTREVPARPSLAKNPGANRIRIGYSEHKPSSGTEDPRDLAQSASWRTNVLKHIPQRHEIVTLILKARGFERSSNDTQAEEVPSPLRDPRNQFNPSNTPSAAAHPVQKAASCAADIEHGPRFEAKRQNVAFARTKAVCRCDLGEPSTVLIGTILFRVILQEAHIAGGRILAKRATS